MSIEDPRPYQPDMRPPPQTMLETLRQLWRPALGGICALGLSDHFFLSQWFRGAPPVGTEDLLILAGLAALLAGIRGLELFAPGALARTASAIAGGSAPQAV